MICNNGVEIISYHERTITHLKSCNVNSPFDIPKSGALLHFELPTYLSDEVLASHLIETST